MTTPVLRPGAVLFLRPEDVSQDIDEGFYGLVISTNGDSAVVEPLGGAGEIGTEAIPMVTAVRRQVPQEEPTGSRVSTLLRQAVACAVEGRVRFGQVIATGDLGVSVHFFDGARWINREDIVCVVHPLSAILFAEARMNPEHWTEAFIEGADQRVIDFLDDTRGGPPSPKALFQVAAPSVTALGLQTKPRRWYDNRTGQVHETTVEHAIAFTYYRDSDRVIPATLQYTVGPSIGRDPVCAAAAGVSPLARPGKKARLRSTYLASETSYEGEEVAVSTLGPQRAIMPGPSVSPTTPAPVGQSAPATAPAPRGFTSAAARRSSAAATASADFPFFRLDDAAAPTPANTLTPEQAQAALALLLGDDPRARDLLRMATQGNRDPTLHAPLNADVGRRNRHAFTPHDAQVAIHQAIAHPNEQGTSASAFVHRLLSSSAVSFAPYPAVLMLLYEFGFGPRGLSVMHLTRVSLLDRMRHQRDHSVNMNDFSVGVKVPDSRQPSQWSDLHDGINGLVSYCAAYADPVTTQLAYAVASFASAMQSLGHWPETHLDALEFWVNERLGEYRDLVDAEVRFGVGNRADGLAWFVPTNPSLGPLQNMLLQRDMELLRHSRSAANATGRTHQPYDGHGTSAAPKGIPPEVSRAIPRRNGRQLCLRFASKKGCPQAEASFCGHGDRKREHFVASNLPSAVRAYILAKLGGLSTEYAAIA